MSIDGMRAMNTENKAAAKLSELGKELAEKKEEIKRLKREGEWLLDKCKSLEETCSEHCRNYTWTDIEDEMQQALNNKH